MATHYQHAHVTVAPFTAIDRCKPAPNSIIESLACGRPVVVTSKVGLADLIREHCSGVTCGESAESLADALDRVQSDWNDSSARSRSLAENYFSRQRFLQGYAELYEELL
jgi:glycosyltransferase involved in cell wall biosynthesis